MFQSLTDISNGTVNSGKLNYYRSSVATGSNDEVNTTISLTGTSVQIGFILTRYSLAIIYYTNNVHYYTDLFPNSSISYEATSSGIKVTTKTNLYFYVLSTSTVTITVGT